MLRVLLLFLLFANGLYFAWSQGYLRDYGFAPADPSEPHRLAQQVQPEALKVLTPEELLARQAQAKAKQAPRECLLAGPLDENQVEPLRQALQQSFPPGAWRFEAVTVPARWIVYMGKYANAEMLARKRAELSGMELKVEALTNPALEIGLSLGSYATQAAAEQQLARLTKRGIRTARVVLESPQREASLLRLPEVTEELKSRLQDLKPLVTGKGFRACAEGG